MKTYTLFPFFVLLFLFAAAETPARPSGAPRKVVIGTVMHWFRGEYPGLEARLKEITGLADSVAMEAEAKYPGEGLDLVMLPETAVTEGKGNTAATRAVKLDGPVLEKMGALARKHRTYFIVPLVLDEGGGKYTNSAVLLDRTGKVAGIYRKVHPVAAKGENTLENGLVPGAEFPVFDCDFGRLGIQICFDMSYPDGWEALARKGAEIVAVTSASPQTVRPAAYALMGKYYVVTSTPRENASVFNPIGRIDAQIKNPGALVHRIDLSYEILHWSPTLNDGRLFTRRYGGRAGYVYYTDEDTGVFWSNDPKIPILQMVKELGLETREEQVERVRVLQDTVRGGKPEGKQ
jgi:apolipoprotein N-acyltransferase